MTADAPAWTYNFFPKTLKPNPLDPAALPEVRPMPGTPALPRLLGWLLVAAAASNWAPAAEHSHRAHAAGTVAPLCSCSTHLLRTCVRVLNTGVPL